MVRRDPAASARRRKAAAKPARAATTAKRKAPRGAGTPKYHDGAGRTWTGVGKRPTWFKEALAAGKTAEDLLIG
nr:H-NS family nucleoid-associated regulatory protein [Mitsuaria sp. TWR114]